MVKVTEYAKNLAKSAGYAFVNSTKESYQNIAAFSDTNSEIFRSAYDGIRNRKSVAKRVATRFKQSPAFEISSMFIKNAIEDIKTGDFYNEARIADYETKYGGDLFSIGDFELPDLGFDPEDVGSLNIQDGDLLVSRAIVKSNKISANSLATAVMRGSQATVEANKEIASMFYTQNIEMTRQISNTVGVVNENLTKGFKDLTEINRVMSEQQAKYFSNTTDTLKSINDKLESIQKVFVPKEEYKSSAPAKHTVDSVMGASVDLKAYLNEIKTRGVSDAIGQIPLIGSFLNPDFLKQMDGMMGGSMFRQAAANPMQAVMNALVGGMVPKTLKQSVEKLDASVGSFFPAFIGRMNSMAKTGGYDSKSTVMRMVGKLFGLDTDEKTSISYKSIKGKAVAWDDMSKHYLEEVIPYYLRKMTAAITGTPEMMFDTRTGKWSKISTVRNDFKKDIESQYARPFRSSMHDFDTGVKDATAGIAWSTPEEKAQFEKDYDNFKKYVYRQGDINIKGKHARELGMSSDRNLNILRQAMNSMDPSTVMELIAEIQNTKRTTTNKYKGITPGTALYKLFTEGEDLDFTRQNTYTARVNTVDQHLENKKSSTSVFNLTQLSDDFNKTIYDYLRMINTNIEFFKTNGMITYPQGGNFGVGAAPIGPQPQNTQVGQTLSNIPIGYMDRVNNSNANLVSNTQTRNDAADVQRQNERTSYANSLNWIRQNANNIVVDANTDMEDILANMQATSECQRKEARRELEDDESIIDIFTDGQARRQKNKAKFEQLTSFKDKWAASSNIGEKVFLVKDKLQSWIDAPSQMMEKAVLAADRHLFDLLYKTSTQMTDENGQPVQGFMGLLKFKAMETFNVVSDTVKDIFGKAKDKLANTKFGKWLAEMRDKLKGDENSPLGKFKAAFKQEFNNIKDSYKMSFEKLGEAFGVQDYAEKIKNRRKELADAMTPEEIGKVLATEASNDAETIKKVKAETDEEHNLRASTMSDEDKLRYNDLRSAAGKMEKANAKKKKLDDVIADASASEAAKKAAQRQLDIINKYLEPAEKIKQLDPTADRNDELNKLFDVAIKQASIQQTARNNKDLKKQIAQNQNIIDTADATQYTSDEERQQAVDKAKSDIEDLNKQITQNTELIKHTVEELKAVNEQRAYVEEQLKQADANTQLINNLSTNPFEAVFAAADAQRQAFQSELDKAIADLKEYRKKYEEYNAQAVAIHEQLTDPTANISDDVRSDLESKRDEFTQKANEMRGTYIPQANSIKDRAEKRLARNSAKFDGNIEEVLKRFVVDNSVVNKLDQERRDNLDKYDSQWRTYTGNILLGEPAAPDDPNSPVYRDANGQFRSRAERDNIKAERDKFDHDIFSAEYAANLDPKTARFLADFAKNKEMIANYAATITDPEMKAKFERAVAGNYLNGEYNDINEATTVRYKDVTNAGFFARGGKNTSSKPKISIMSKDEKIITSAGSVYNVPKMGIYSIPGKATVINPADEATISKQAIAEKNFKKDLLTNARVDDGLAKITDIAKDVGYKGAARGAIGGIAGLLVGNPLLGAALGVGSQVVESNKFLNEAFYGSIIEYDEQGNPIRANDGLIKQNIQQAMPDMKTGAAIGSVAGLLGGPFGIVGGSLIGAGLGFLKNTKFVQDKIFGDGMILSKDNRNAIKKAFPNVAIGAATGALLGPFGLVGGALLGGAGGFLTTTEKFKTALLGEKQEDGSREGGVVGALKDNLVTPLKNFGLDMLDEMKENFKEDFLNPIKDAIAPITTELKNAFMIVPNMIADTFKEHISVPLSNLVRDYIATPIKNLTMGITKKAVDLIRFPFKLIGKGLFGGLGNIAKTKGIKNGRAGGYMTAAERNEFRQRNKARFLVGDKYAEFDKNLAQYSETASVDDLELIKNSIAYNVDGERGLNKEMGKNSRDIGKKISSKFQTRFGNAARAIDRAIEKDNYEKAFDLIRNTKTIDGKRMTKDESDAFIAEVQELLKQRDELKAKKETYKATDEQVAEYASKLGIKNFNKKSAKQKRSIMDALNAEINSKRAAATKYGTNEAANNKTADMQADIYSTNAEAVKESTNAFADFAAALKNVTTFMNGIGNFENLEQNTLYNNGKRQRFEQYNDIREIQNTFNEDRAKREANFNEAAEADDNTYDRERQRFIDTHIAKLLKFKLYSKVTEKKYPALFDVTAEDRVRLLNDMGDRGWFIDKECLNDFLELSETDANKIYNISKFAFTGEKKFVFKKKLIDTICTLTKKESTKLGNNLSEKNVYVLNTYAEDPAGLKTFISAFSNKNTKFREFNLKARFNTSNNVVARNLGRAAELVRSKIENSGNDIASKLVSETMQENGRFVEQSLNNFSGKDFILSGVSSNAKMDDQRDMVMQAIAESRMFKDDPRYSVKALKNMTTDELHAIYRQLPTNAFADDKLEAIDVDYVDVPDSEITAKAGSKAAAEEKKAKASKLGIFTSMKNTLSNIASFLVPKDEQERRETFLDKLKKGIGKIFGIGKYVVGVPLIIGAMAKWVVPFIKDKMIPWLVGEKDSSGNYSGGIASGVVNGFKNTVLPWIEDVAVPKVKSVLSDMWQTGMTTLKDDILPATMDILIDKLPEILTGAIQAAYELIKSGAKAVATKTGFGKSGDVKAETDITNATRDATKNGEEVNESKIKIDAYKSNSSGSFAKDLVRATVNPVGEEAADVAITNANAELYNANKGSGTQFIEDNYGGVIDNNETFQGIRDKEVQETYANGYGSKSLVNVMGRTFVNNAAGMGKLGNGVLKFGTKVFKGVSKVPGLGVVGKLGQGTMKVIGAPAKAGNALHQWIAKTSAKAAANVATDVAGEAVETATKAAVTTAADGGRKAKLLTKITTFLKDVLTKLFQNNKIINKIAPLAEKIGMSKAALGKKFASMGEKLASKLATKLGLESVEVLAKIAGKATVILAIAAAVLDFIMGWDDARNILGIVDEEVSLFERFFAGLINVISGLVAGIIPADWLANVFLDLFAFLGADFAEAIKKKQDAALEAIDLYNAENGTDFETVEDFNAAVNPTTWQKIKSGTKEWFTNAGKSISNFFTKGDKKDKDESKSDKDTEIDEEIKTNAYTNDGLEAFAPDEVDGAIDELLMNAKANDKLANVKLTPAGMIKKAVTDPITTIFGKLMDGKTIVDEMSRYESINKTVNTQISDGKLKANNKKYWEIVTAGNNTFAASLFKLSEFMRRAIGAPLAIIQDAINTAFDTETTAATKLTTSEVSASGTLPSTASVSTESMTDTSSTTESKPTKKKGVLASLFSSITSKFKKNKSGSGKNSEYKNRKLKYLIPPKPITDEQASYLKGQYSGGSNTESTPHLYQRDYNDRFNISGDSNFQSIADSGCGPVVASELLARKGKGYNVHNAAKAALKYKEKDGGTFPQFFDDYLGANGVETNYVTTRNDLRKRLNNGEEVVLMGQSGSGKTPFGSANAHYVLATGMKNNDIVIQDPEDPNANAIYNANDTIKDSIYAISTGRGINRKPVALGYKTAKKSGTGTLTAQQETNLYYMLHELNLKHEAGGDYASVTPDDNGSLSIGCIGFHNNIATDVLNQIADRISDSDDAAFLRQIGPKGESGIISSSDADRIREILEKNAEVAKDVEDKKAFELYKSSNLAHPLKMYNAGRLKNPVSMLVPADIYNTGIHNGWAEDSNWSSSKTGAEEVDEVTNRMATASWWANSSSQYRNGWVNRIKDTGNLVRNLDIDNYTQGSIFDGFSSTATIGSDGSVSSSDTTSNTFIGQLGSYVVKALKKLYGGLYDAIFGGNNTAAGITGNGDVGKLGAEDYIGTVEGGTADDWFLGTMEGASMSSGYRTSDRPDHAGIDYAASEGTKIYSPVDGTVVFSGWNTGGYGNLVIVQDTHGYYHIFGHQAKDPTTLGTTEGKEVYRGSYLGQVGNTGESFGAHLHYQVNDPSDMWHGDVDPNTYDYSEYIKNAETRASGTIVYNEAIGPQLPGTEDETATDDSTETTESTKSASGLASSGQSKPLGSSIAKKAVKAANGKTTNAAAACGIKQKGKATSATAFTKDNSKKIAAFGKNVKCASASDASSVEQAITALGNAAEAASVIAGNCNTSNKTETGTAHKRQLAGATSGSNTMHIGAGGASNATNEILLAIVKLLSEISGNTSKLEDVVAAVAKLSVSNAVQLTGTASETTNKSSSNKSDVMAQLTKALLSSGGNTRAGLNALNAQFQTMNNSQIIDAVYKIAKQ